MGGALVSTKPAQFRAMGEAGANVVPSLYVLIAKDHGRVVAPNETPVELAPAARGAAGP